MDGAQVKYGGGPYGYGDPNDKTLRKVETEVLIPKKMREIATREICIAEVAAFSKCAKNSGITMVFSCREENDKMKKCLTENFENPEFRERCTKEYLAERSEFRRTGITKKKAATIRELMVEVEAERRAKNL